MIKSGWRLERVRWECKLADCWIGVFWRRDHTDYGVGRLCAAKVLQGMDTLDVWICVVPCLPLHLTWQRPTLEVLS